MKLIKTLAIGAASLASVSLASATTVPIYIVGSNGDRSATQKGIENQLAANGDWYFWGDKGAAKRVSGTVTAENNALNSNYGVWKGTYNGNTVVIKTSFIGAAGAVYTLAGLAGNTTRFVAQSDPQANFPVSTSTALKSPFASDATTPTDYENHGANFGFSTNFQDTTPYTDPGTYDILDATKVGVSPIVFIASPGFPGDGITTQQAQNLYSSGSLNVSLFTGNQSDVNKIVYAIGRNTDAGQRYATYSEFGLGTSKAVKVWQPTIAGQTTVNNIKYGGTVTSHKLWPIETVSGVISKARGDGGYDTGGNLAPALTVASIASDPATGKDTGSATPNAQPYPSATAAYYIGYITTGDYTTRVQTQSPGSVLLKYNGVPYSAAAVQNGSYTSWVYNRILARSDGVGLTDEPTGTATALYNGLTTEIKNNTATENGGLLLNSLNVKRNADGGLVLPGAALN